MERAAYLAKEGYRHAAEAERAAALAHDAVAASIEKRAERHPEESAELQARATQHRESAQAHRRDAEYDERRLAELDAD